MSMLSTFMESYSQNVQITGGDLSLDEMFRDVAPASYDQVMECVYDLQYSTEAVCTMTEFACNLNESGAAVLTEGLISSAASAIWNKLKELASKIKGFVVKICKNIADFINSLYMKANPLDKVMQATNKKVVEWKDIQTAKNNEWKLPGTYKLIGDVNVVSLDVDQMRDKVADVTDVKTRTLDSANGSMFGLRALAGVIKSATNDNDKDYIEQKIEKAKNEYEEMYEDYTKFWDSINPFLTEDKFGAIGGKDAFFKKSEKSDEDQDFTEADWKLIKTIALEGQSRNKKFQNDVKKSGKSVIDDIEKTANDISKIHSKDEGAADINKILSIVVKTATLSANHYIKTVNKLYMPVLKKQHREAIRTFIYVQGSVKSKVKKVEKAFK